MCVELVVANNGIGAARDTTVTSSSGKLVATDGDNNSDAEVVLDLVPLSVAESIFCCSCCFFGFGWKKLIMEPFTGVLLFDDDDAVLSFGDVSAKKSCNSS